MPRPAVECPWCAVVIIIAPGGWAYRRSQIVIHLLDCEKKPAGVTPAEVNLTADRVMESAG